MSKQKNSETANIPDEKAYLEAALTVAADLDWDMVTLRDIAQQAGGDLAGLHGYFRDKTDISYGIGRLIDERVLKNLPEPEVEASPKERLFEILMERFDVLQDMRPAVLSIVRSVMRDPKQGLFTASNTCRSMTWMLELAGLDTTGIKGAVLVAGLAAVYAQVLRTWARDESEDMSATMAALDKTLGKAENLANRFAF